MDGQRFILSVPSVEDGWKPTFGPWPVLGKSVLSVEPYTPTYVLCPLGRPHDLD